MASVGLKSFEPFISDGVVSLVSGDKRVCVKILCETAAFDSLILTSVLSFQMRFTLVCLSPCAWDGVEGSLHVSAQNDVVL